MRTWQAENFGAGTGERKEAACRQKSGHERKRKLRAGRKAGTRAEGSCVSAKKRTRERKETVCRQKSRHERKSRRSKIVGISACLFYFCGGFISPYLPLYRKSASLELNADDFTLFWETICSASKTNLFHIKAMSSFCLFSISPIFLCSLWGIPFFISTS